MRENVARPIAVLYTIAALSGLVSCMGGGGVDDDDGVETAFPNMAVSEVRSGFVNLAGGAQEVEFSVYSGQAVLDGDILLGDADGIPAVAPPLESASAVMVDRGWPLGVVPYEISAGFGDAQREDIKAAIAYWNETTLYRLVSRQSQGNYVRFQHVQSGCSSYLGRRGGRQDINLGPNCGEGTVKHEIGHAVGLLHEQTRSDRDNFVKIVWWNIKPDMAHNFKKYTRFGYNARDLGVYDRKSIMHYSGNAFALDSTKPTITDLDRVEVTAQRVKLTTTDIAGATEAYHLASSSAKVRLRNLGTGLCAKPTGAQDQGPVKQYGCNDLSNRAFHRVNPLDGGVGLVFISAKTRSCLEVQQSSTATNARLVQAPCNGQPNQRLVVTREGMLMAQHSGKCIAPQDGSASNGTMLVQVECDNTGLKQRWMQVSAP